MPGVIQLAQFEIFVPIPEVLSLLFRWLLQCLSLSPPFNWFVDWTLITMGNQTVCDPQRDQWCKITESVHVGWWILLDQCTWWGFCLCYWFRPRFWCFMGMPGVSSLIEVISPSFYPWNYEWHHYQWEPLLWPCDWLCRVWKAYGLHFHSRSTLYQSLLLLPRPLGLSFLKILLEHFVKELLSLFLCHAFQCSDHHVWSKLYIIDLGFLSGRWCFGSSFWHIISVVHHFHGAGIGLRGVTLFLSCPLGAVPGHMFSLSTVETPSFFAEDFSFLICERFQLGRIDIHHVWVFCFMFVGPLFLLVLSLVWLIPGLPSNKVTGFNKGPFSVFPSGHVSPLLERSRDHIPFKNTEM